MATISGCQRITAWLEDSPVISDTALWHSALLAIHSHHPAIIIASDTIINQASSWPCAACLTPTHTNKRGGGTQTHSKTPGDIVKKEQKPKSQITQDPSSKKTPVPDSHVSSVSALCQTKAVNESG